MNWLVKEQNGSVTVNVDPVQAIIENAEKGNLEKPTMAKTIKKKTKEKLFSDVVNSPAHYTYGGIETIDFIEAKQLNYHCGNVVKYVSRAGKKGERLEDLRKAQWYLNREIERLEKE
jgi:Protein of unknwon function (DUF3310)